ncbi:hypothetical protein NBRC116494_01030 [Aurantivibrio plasticivorans]
MIINITPSMEESLLQLEYLDIALTIGATWWFPFIESIHVLAATFMLGMLLMVDLRLLGVAAKHYSVNSILKQQLPWVWLGFVVAVVTGGLMFITNALAYASNPAMQYKLLLILIAGLNTVFLHALLKPMKRVADQLNSVSSNTGFQLTAVAGGVSLSIWVAIIFAGRWIGHIQ